MYNTKFMNYIIINCQLVIIGIGIGIGISISYVYSFKNWYQKYQLNMVMVEPFLKTIIRSL